MIKWFKELSDEWKITIFKSIIAPLILSALYLIYKLLYNLYIFLI
jgi:hypothetical protein